MKKYRVAVCKGPDCRGNGSDAVFAAMKESVAKRGLQATCHVFRGGCYGLCQLGPNVVIREDLGKPRDPLSREDFQLLGTPEETYYPHMDAAKVETVAEAHLKADGPVKELLVPFEAVDELLGNAD